MIALKKKGNSSPKASISSFSSNPRKLDKNSIQETFTSNSLDSKLDLQTANKESFFCSSS